MQTIRRKDVKQFKIMKKYKRIIAIFAIVLLVAVIELGFNYSALKWRYSELDLRDNIQVIKTETNEKYVVEFANKEGLYVKQLKIVGDFNQEDGYWIDITWVNEFGKKVTSTSTDVVNAYFSEFYTNINKKITNIKITMPKPEGSNLKSVWVTNHFEINKYRVFFFFILLLLLYLIFFEKNVVKWIERYFVIYSLAFGMLLIACVQPRYCSWDEQIHFKTAYSLASGKNVEWTEAALDIVNRIVPSCNTKAEFAELRKLMNEKGKEISYTEKKENIGISYSTISYIPMAVFMKIGMLLKVSFSDLFMLGKIGNLFFYVFIMYEALCRAKRKKLFLAFIAMLPTPLFLAVSYSYDPIVFACVTLGCVLWYDEMTSGRKRYQLGNVIAAILLFSVGCFSKAVYVPIILVMLLLPQFQKKDKKQQLIWFIGILAVCALVMMTFVLPAITNTISGNISYGGDNRGGDTSLVRQLMSMIKYPLSSIKLMINSIFSFDNFRNVGTAAGDNYFIGNLLFLNFASLGILPEKWLLILVPMFVLLLLYEERKMTTNKELCLGKRVFVVVILIAVIVLIWLSMYLSFTPVGQNTIAGVQARYYLPLLYLGALILPGKRTVLQADYYKMARLTLLSVNVLQIAIIYEIVLKYRMF
jgi:uncharacterized membrane protein